MLQIFKYFFGIIGVLILVYVLLVVLRMVLSSGFTTGASVLTDPQVQENVASTTKDVVNAVGQFTLANFLRSFRPFAYAPIEVTTDVSDRATPKYYNDDLSNYKPSWRENLNWQNLRDAPNTHPTDFVPIGTYYYDQLNSSGVESGKEEVKITDKYIYPKTRKGEILNNYDILSGHAYFKTFSMGKFPIYILDENGNTISRIYAFVNGSIDKYENVPFRAVLDLSSVYISRGYLMYKNENTDITGIRSVKLVPVYFNH